MSSRFSHLILQKEYDGQQVQKFKLNICEYQSDIANEVY